ncbi:sulfatase-like hydrolase/transferase [Spirochaetia bacterium 38H-sp]|uniref:Sulfatase-like hydrolase/transferase n=1 Tax=Rarispira pelagica TaxID=3141764 RepID=A0ABU9UDN7_9SPIR
MKRPNILIINTDQQRWDALGINNPNYITPNLDNLAKESYMFDMCFVQNPLCMPSRASVWTGKYPSSLGILDMAIPLPEDQINIAHIFNIYGYDTSYFGKMHFIPHANRDHRELHPSYGFSHLEISDEPGAYEDDYYYWAVSKEKNIRDRINPGMPPAAFDWYRLMGKKSINSPYFPDVPRDDFLKTWISKIPKELSHSSFVADKTSVKITSSSSPWLIMAGFFAPHAPMIASKDFLNLYDATSIQLPQYTKEELDRLRNANISMDTVKELILGYRAMVSEVDYNVGKIIKSLKDSGEYENTIIVFTSDHGEWLGDCGRFSKGYPADDAVSRVPLLIRIPESVSDVCKPGRGIRIKDICEGVDILPTVLELAGIKRPPHLDGKSICNLINGDRHKDFALTEHRGWKTIRTEEYRYLIKDDGKEFLWDANNDVYCRNNLADYPSYKDVLSNMRLLLLEFLVKRDRGKDPVWPY